MPKSQAANVTQAQQPHANLHDAELGHQPQATTTESKSTIMDNLWWAAKALGTAAVIVTTYYVGMRAAGAPRGNNNSVGFGNNDNNDLVTPLTPFTDINARRADLGVCIDPLVAVKQISSDALNPNSGIAMASDPMTGYSVTLFSQINRINDVFELNSAATDNLNHRLQLNTKISFLGSVDQPYIVRNQNGRPGYTAMWRENGQNLVYQFLDNYGNLVDPTSIEQQANANTVNDGEPTGITGSSPNSLAMIFASTQFNAQIGATDHQLYYTSVVNGVATPETSFTSPSSVSYSSFSGLYTFTYNFYNNPAFVTGPSNTPIVFYAYVSAAPQTVNNNPPPTPPANFKDIRYITNPAIASNAKGTSITGYFSSSYYFTYPAALTLPASNTMAVAYLGQLKTAPPNSWNVYVQLLTNALAVNGNPITLPFVTTGNAAPILVPTLIQSQPGFGVFAASGTPPQANYIGFNPAGTVVTGPVQLSPSLNAQSIVSGKVDSSGNIVVDYTEGSKLLSILRTTQLQMLFASNQSYTENTPYNLQVEITSPINVPTGNTTQVTLSVNNGATWAVANTLPGAGTATFNATNTQVVLQTTDIDGLTSLNDMNLNLGCVQVIPPQNSYQPVTVTMTVVSGQYNVTQTYNLTGTQVYYAPQWANGVGPVIDVEQGETVPVTMANFNVTVVPINGVIPSVTFPIYNPQHCSFIKVADASLPLSNPGTVVTSLLSDDIKNDLIRYRHDGGTIAPTFNTEAIGPAGKSLGQVAGTVNFHPGFAPQIGNAQPIILNQGGTIILNRNYLNASDPVSAFNIPMGPANLTYTIVQVPPANYLTFKYRVTLNSSWINYPVQNPVTYPNAIQSTQEQVDEDLFEITHSGATDSNIGFSYVVTNALGLSSTVTPANIALNLIPVWNKDSFTYTQLKVKFPITSQGIDLQDDGDPSQIGIFIAEASECTIYKNGKALAVNQNIAQAGITQAAFTQADINNGLIEGLSTDANMVLKLVAKDKYGATTAAMTISAEYQPSLLTQLRQHQFTKGEIAGLISGPTMFALGIGKFLYERNKKFQEEYPLAYLVRKTLGLTGVSVFHFSSAKMIQYGEAIEAISVQLQKYGVTFRSLPEGRQHELARAVADFFHTKRPAASSTSLYDIGDTAYGDSYLITKRTAPTLLPGWNAAANAVSPIKELELKDVKRDAGKISAKVNEIYRDTYLPQNLNKKGGGGAAKIELSSL